MRGESVPQMICNVLAEEGLAFGFRYSSDCDEDTLKQLDKDFIELIKNLSREILYQLPDL